LLESGYIFACQIQTRDQKKEEEVSLDSESTSNPESVSNDNEQSGTSTKHDGNKTLTDEAFESAPSTEEIVAIEEALGR